MALIKLSWLVYGVFVFSFLFKGTIYLLSALVSPGIWNQKTNMEASGIPRIAHFFSCANAAIDRSPLGTPRSSSSVFLCTCPLTQHRHTHPGPKPSEGSPGNWDTLHSVVIFHSGGMFPYHFSLARAESHLSGSLFLAQFWVCPIAVKAHRPFSH